MKRYLLFINCVCLFFTTNAQIIYTPKGNIVASMTITEEYTEAEKNACKSFVEENYPNAVFVSDATTTYNCHSYAWNMQEVVQADTVWINDPSPYWLDGSYIETTLYDSDRSIVFYANNSMDGWHSARFITYGYFRSKWGSLGVYEHAYNDCPYDYSNLRYYKSAQKMEGPLHFCSTGYFNISPMNNVNSITWNVSTNSGINGSNSFSSFASNILELTNYSYMQPRWYSISAYVTYNTGQTRVFSTKASSNEASPNIGYLYWTCNHLSGSTSALLNTGAIELENIGSKDLQITAYQDLAGYSIANPIVSDAEALDLFLSWNGNVITMEVTDEFITGEDEIRVSICTDCSTESIPFTIPVIIFDVNAYSLSLNDVEKNILIEPSPNSKARKNTNIKYVKVYTTNKELLITYNNPTKSASVNVDISSLPQNSLFVVINDGEKDYYKKLIINK